MKPLTAVKKYLEKDSVHGKIATKEFVEFKKSCDPDDFANMAIDAAENLGVELDKN